MGARGQSWATHLWWRVLNEVLHEVVADPLLHVHSVLPRERKPTERAIRTESESTGGTWVTTVLRGLIVYACRCYDGTG